MATISKACAAFGVMTTRDRLQCKASSRGCDHEPYRIDGEEAGFCPRCGEPTWVESTETSVGNKLALAGFRLFFGKNNQDVLVAGLCMEAEAGFLFLSPRFINCDEFRIKMEGVLKPLGLWDESAFGLWTFLNEEYESNYP